MSCLACVVGLHKSVKQDCGVVCLLCVVGLHKSVKQDCGVSYLVYAAFPSTGRSRPKSGAAPSMASLVAAQTRYSLISDGVGGMCESVEELLLENPGRACLVYAVLQEL